MQTRTFVADNMKEAIQMVKHQLGSEAVIVSTRTLKSKLSGITGKSKVEVTVGLSPKKNAPLQANLARYYGKSFETEPSFRSDLNGALDSVQDVHESDDRSEDPGAGTDIAKFRENMDRMMAEIKEIKEAMSGKPGDTAEASADIARQVNEISQTVGQLAGKNGAKSENMLVRELQNIKQFMDSVSTRKEESRLDRTVLRELRTLKDRTERLIFTNRKRNKLLYDVDVNELFQNMLLSGVSEQCALELIDELDVDLQKYHLSASRYGKDCLAGIVMDRVKVSGPLWNDPDQKSVVALVGPTGVGKTTTIAKLAAEQVFERKRKVALLTVDTFRIGAVDQLKTYAKIISAPCDVAYNEKEFHNLLKIHQDKDMILVDTVGMNQKDSQMIDQLSTLFTGENQVETHLVLSATTGERDAQDVVNKFKAIPLSSLMISKIDETTAFGSMFNVIQDAEIPISYFTIGQNVPEDIEIASPERVAALVLNICVN